jgi:TolB-like protein
MHGGALTYTAEANVGSLQQEECREHLARVLNSGDFESTARERRFLEYVVAQTLADRGGRINAFTIAVEVFGRSELFNPQRDPIVRIVASNLRRSLERYYLKAGRLDTVIIGIPTGTYVPTFMARAVSQERAWSSPDDRLEDPDRSPPNPEQIRAQLGRIAISTEFPATGRSGAFLNYIVEEALAGRGHRIKAYSIGLEVFSRNESFTQDDPVVRIEASRLRRFLERYYLVAGQNDPIRIEIPKGGYVPVFHWNTPWSLEESPGEVSLTDGLGPEPTASRAPRRGLTRLPRSSLVALAAGLVVVAVAAGWNAEVFGPPLALSTKPDVPAILVAPFADLGQGTNAALYTQGFMEDLLTALPRFKEIKVSARESNIRDPADGASNINNELGARVLLSGGVRVSDNQIRVTARLVDTLDNSILWSDDYDNDLRSRDIVGIQTDVANKIATAIAEPYGIITQLDVGRLTHDKVDAYQCTLDFYRYRTEPSVERHAAVRECLQAAVATFPGYATAWGMLSIMYLDEGRFQFNFTQESPAPLERALQVARLAVRLEPQNTRALQALMMALFFNGQVEESLRIGEQALATNPNDTEFLREYVSTVAQGAQGRGVSFNQVLALSPGAASYTGGSRGLAAHLLGDEPSVAHFSQRGDPTKVK